METLADMVGKLNGMMEKLDEVAYEVGEKLNETEEIGEKVDGMDGERLDRMGKKLDEMGKNFDEILGQGFDGLYSSSVCRRDNQG